MNKLTKAAIAGAAGIALLLGGAGSLAYWNSETGLNGGSVSSGNLTIEAAAAPTNVMYAFNGGTPAAFNPATNKIVPGDVVTMTQDVTITAVGEHLKVDLTIDKTAIVGNDLADAITVTVNAFTSTNVAVPTTGMTAAQAASIDYVTVSISFDSATTDEEAQNLSVALGDLKVLLTQTV